LRSMGFFNISIRFLIDRVTIMPYIGMLDLWPGRPQALMTMSPKLKTILILRPFKRVLICLILMLSNARKGVFFLVRVLVKAIFPDSKTTNPKSQTVLFTNGTILKILAL
jgi:hypothetical protein